MCRLVGQGQVSSVGQASLVVADTHSSVHHEAALRKAASGPVWPGMNGEPSWGWGVMPVLVLRTLMLGPEGL